MEYKFKKSKHGEIDFLAPSYPQIYNLNSNFLKPKNTRTRYQNTFAPLAHTTVIRICSKCCARYSSQLLCTSFLRTQWIIFTHSVWGSRVRGCSGNKSKLMTNGVTWTAKTHLELCTSRLQVATLLSTHVYIESKSSSSSHISVMELGHLLTRSGLTCPEVSSKACLGSFLPAGD
jgi:hypothetical protein